MTVDIREQNPTTSGDEAEAAYETFVWQNLKRNYLAHYLHGMLGMTGFRVFNAPTLLPAYLYQLSGSDFMVGLGLSLQQVGQIVSPVIGAGAVEHRKRVLPAAMVMGTMMRLPILLMAVAAWLLSGHALVWTTMGLLLMLGFFSGAQRVVFQLLLAKVIPISVRGRLQAFRNITGGLIAAVLSYLAGRYLIEHQVFGNGYAVTFVIVFVLTSLGLTALRTLMREPEPPGLREPTKLRERMKDFRGLIGADRDYRNFLIAQSLAVAGRMAAPFYVLHAGKVVHVNGSALGLFSLAYLGADTASNLAWGYFGDRSGFKSNFVAAMVIGVAALTLLIFADTRVEFLIAFLGLGASASGYLMASQTLVLEFGERKDVAMRLAISATNEGILAAIGPALGGLIVAASGYKVVFGLAIALQFAALMMLLLGVTEPRRRVRTALFG